MKPLDTDNASFQTQLAVYRRMPASDRVALAIRMSEEARSITADGIRARHPEYDRDQVRLALLRLILGDDLFHRAFAGSPILQP
jgi:hypothetical protein